jgi:hypothetical protein
MGVGRTRTRTVLFYRPDCCGIKTAEVGIRGWSAALDAHVDLAKRDPLFDPEVIAISTAVARMAADGAPAQTVPAPIRAALSSAAPIYRAHVWPAQSRANEEWIASVEPIATRHAAPVIEAIAAAYGTTWPREPILVDVASEAGRLGAYTTDGPHGTAAHTTI